MNIIYFVPNITIAGGIFRIVSDKMNYLAENMEGRLFLAYYGNGQEKPVYPLHPNIQLLPINIEWKVGFGKKINGVWKNISMFGGSISFCLGLNRSTVPAAAWGPKRA